MYRKNFYEDKEKLEFEKCPRISGFPDFLKDNPKSLIEYCFCIPYEYLR